METYSLLRHMADSWGLLALFLMFLGVILWAFRPGSRATHRDIAGSIFRHEDRPADTPLAVQPENLPRSQQPSQPREA